MGLLLSETQILVNFSTFTSVTYFPYFVLAFQLLTVGHLLFSFLGYAFAGQQHRATSLELHEHILLPLSVLFFSLLAANAGLITIKILVVLMLVLQSLVVAVKIIYFSSLVPQLAQ